MKLLYVQGSPKSEQDSNSLSVGRYLVNAVLRSNPNATVDEINVYESGVPLIDRHFLSARGKLAAGATVDDLPDEEQAIARKLFRFTDQFIAAEVYVFAYPLWNFSLPPMLKAYIDTVKVARRTFRYTPRGPEGLLRGKRAVVIQSSGDVYSHGPLKDLEHGSRYLSSVLGFLGVEPIERILMEGMDMTATDKAAVRKRAMAQASVIAAELCAAQPPA